MTFHSLRTRLALSHILPILVIVPLLGLLLLVQLERDYFLKSLAIDLQEQGELMAELINNYPMLWSEPSLAQGVQASLQTHEFNIGIELFDAQGHLLASPIKNTDTESVVAEQSTVVQKALQGKSDYTVDSNVASQQRVVDVAVPIFSEDGQLMGVLRLFRLLDDVQDRLKQLRWLVLATIFAGGAFSLLLGLLLARSLGTPLIRLQQIVERFSPNTPFVSAPVAGPQEVKSLAISFNRMSRRLVELAHTRKLLLAGIVHELGRPLGSMKMAAHTIATSDDADLSRELAEGIVGQIDQLRLHLDDLTLLGEMESHPLQLMPQPVEINALVDAQCRQLEPLTTLKRQHLYTRYADSLPPIQADAHRLAQILGNLLHNAVKYTPEGGQIRVETGLEQIPQPSDPPDQWLAIHIQDSGPGIAADEQARIFDFFYRNPQQERTHEGMGIGLALARQLTEAHGGTLHVESTLGQGASFTLRLPV